MMMNKKFDYNMLMTIGKEDWLFDLMNKMVMYEHQY